MDKNQLFLVQTDTTVGFLTSSQNLLREAKNRDDSKPFLMVLDSLEELKKYVRVNKVFRRKVRKSKKTTFVYSNNLSFRVIDNSFFHHKFIKKYKALYSSSANLTGCNFNLEFAYDKASIIIETKKGFSENNPSKIYKLYKKKYKKIR
jgi:tRNA A37 threonylcarbamoyladenosine synthetase subunit TsaC/SUA5/YrdC